MSREVKGCKGFTLVELMIVVAIIGILAAVAIPYYQRYVAKSRLTSLVFPGIHSIETNLSTFYAVSNALTGFNSSDMMADADTDCFKVELPVLDEENSSIIAMHITIDSSSTKCKKLSALEGKSFTVKGTVTGKGKLSWTYSGGLAKELGL